MVRKLGPRFSFLTHLVPCRTQAASDSAFTASARSGSSAAVRPACSAVERLSLSSLVVGSSGANSCLSIEPEGGPLRWARTHLVDDSPVGSSR